MAGELLLDTGALVSLLDRQPDAPPEMPPSLRRPGRSTSAGLWVRPISRLCSRPSLRNAESGDPSVTWSRCVDGSRASLRSGGGELDETPKRQVLGASAEGNRIGLHHADVD